MSVRDEDIQALIDERAIRTLLLRYCRAVDRCDRDAIAACFHADAIDDHGNWIVDGTRVADHIVSLVQPGPGRAMHFMGNVLVEVDGDTAFAESYILAFRTFTRDGQPYNRTRALRFIDRFERQNGQWRISERNAIDEWNRVDLIVEQQGDTDTFRYGRKDQNDPVYAIRQGRVAR
jgi:ketosteroid isomerase-like protein